MKLKRILAGALAAVVSISTVALASLSTASAADPIDISWYGDGAGKLEGAQFKVVQNWGAGTEVLEGAEEFYISFDIANDNAGLQAYLIFQDIGNKHSNWNYSAAADAACPAVDCSKAGTYTVGYKGAAITTGFNFLAVAFVDADGKEYGNDPLKTAGITLKGVYAEAPTTEPDTTEPDTTEPVVVEPTEETIDSIEYNFTVTGGGNNTVTIKNQKVGWGEGQGSVAVTDSGDYSIKITGMAATGLTNLGFIDPASGDVTVTMNTIVVNDKYTFEVGKSLTTTGANMNGMANIWNDEGKAAVVYTVTADGKTATLVGSASDSVGIKLMVGPAAEPDTTEPQPTDPQPTDPQPTDPQPTTPSDIAIDACLGIAKVDFTPSTFKNPAFGTVVTGDGQYTITVDVQDLPDDKGGTGYPAIDTLGVLVIDFLDAAVNYPNMTATLDKIELDGAEYEFDASKLIFGNLEKDNDHSRLEIYNLYGGTKADSPVDAAAFYAEDKISLTFTVSGLTGEPDTTEPDTTEPTTEPCDVTVSITPDKAYALPGSEVTYTVAVTPNQDLGTLQMRMELPEGLSYVPDSFVVDENSKTALGWNVKNGGNVEWTEDTLFLNGFTAASEMTPGTTITLGSFKVVAAEEGTYAPAFTEYEFTNMDFATLSYGVAATAIVYTNEIPTDPTDETDPTDVTNPTDAPVTDPTDAPATDPTNAPKPTSGNDDPTAAPTTAAPTTAAPTTAGGNNGSNNGGNTPNTGAQAAVGLSIFMAAGLAGVVAIKKRRK